jgi:Fe-S oxidoreductase
MFEDLFTLPFLIGLGYLTFIVAYRFIKWTMGLSKIDKIRIYKNVFTRKTLDSFGEAFMEGLLHRKVFRKNRFLGYMHMSLAFGWFLLILVGHIETIVCLGKLFGPVYMPVFYRYFITSSDNMWSVFFAFTMDLLLLLVLSGVALAYYKRFSRGIFGMKKTTRLKSGDRIALASLWMIFPLRLIAESFSAGYYHNGSFLTQSFGNLFSSYIPLHFFIDPAWLLYSISLGVFFVALPNSRYMHIPAEILYIFLKNYGIRLKKMSNTYTDVQVFSCSRCGICLDACQLSGADIRDSQSVYILKRIRNKNLTDEELFKCALCGRCEQACPVDLDLNDLRITQRIESTRQYNSSYDYLREGSVRCAEVIYFAGCMTHLTPSIKKSMVNILGYAGIDYLFMDEEKAPCCGRPLLLVGQYEAARKLINNNQQLILSSGAKQLVVSCPICYKVFKEDYNLPGIDVFHHSEYILQLINKKLIPVLKSKDKIIYHDPCELGRGSGIYEQPRDLLKNYVSIIPVKNQKENSLCCGGSLANIKITPRERDNIRDNTLSEYLQSGPDYLVTSCPLCKKTFAKGTDIPVFDLAEIVSNGIEAARASRLAVQEPDKAILVDELF